MMQPAPSEIALSAELQIERRKFWNRRRRKAGAIWFGAATLIGWTGLLLFGKSPVIVSDVAIATVAATLLGAVFGGIIGTSGRRHLAFAKALICGFVVVFLTTAITLVLSAWIRLSAWLGIEMMIMLVLGAPFFVWPIFKTAGVWIIPIPLVAGLHLYVLRSKLREAPKLLGCAEHAHLAATEAPHPDEGVER